MEQAHLTALVLGIRSQLNFGGDGFENSQANPGSEFGSSQNPIGRKKAQ